MCENLTWSNYDRNPVLPVLWKCSKMHFLSLIFDMERSRLAKLWIRNNLEFMEWTIQNCPQMLFYVTCRHFYRPLKSCDIRFGMEEVYHKCLPQAENFWLWKGPLLNSLQYHKCLPQAEFFFLFGFEGPFSLSLSSQQYKCLPQAEEYFWPFWLWKSTLSLSLT